MLNNIKISQTTNEIILNVNVIADIHDGYTKDDLVQAFEREFYIYCEKNNSATS